MKARFFKKIFHFKIPSGTSRGVLTEKTSWFIELWNEDDPTTIGIGECSIIPGLSPEYLNDVSYESKLTEVCNNLEIDLMNWPSIKFGVETAKLDLINGGERILFDNTFSRGERSIPINGLIWMGKPDYLRQQIDNKINAGFNTIKMKIGSIDFEQELEILQYIRDEYNVNGIVLRVDANGAFSFEDAHEKLQLLSALDIHSIEQPIKAGNWNQMAQLCKKPPLPIALDEELIGVNEMQKKIEMLETIKPQYIILKPSLHGGLSGTKEWITLAEQRGVQWWITSALESNIGLNAICQFVGEYDNQLPQGLGTGSLYTDNISSRLSIKGGEIYLRK